MNGLSLTRHAVIRLAQRGISTSDADLILLIGSETPDGFLVRDHDYAALEAALKRLLNRLSRLRGKRLVVAGKQLVTAYHARPKEQRRLRRLATERGMGQ